MAAQTKPDDATSAQLQVISEKLDALERQNKEMAEEIRSLRAQLAATQANGQANGNATAQTGPSLQDRVAVVENRVDEQAQTKVEASSRFPISLTGMLLFNAFSNTNGGDRANYAPYLVGSPERYGATVGQTLLGFRLDGPEIPGDGKVSAALDLDFLGGTGYNGYSLRIRRAVVNFDWTNRSFSAGLDKPLISQRAPESLAEVAYPPLSDAGNLWIWVPQIRYTERVHLGTNTGLDFQGSLLGTDENAALEGTPDTPYLEPVRPAFEARVNWWGKNENRRYEIAPGLHLSTSHVNGFSVPSRFGTLDWLVKPASWFEFSGLFFAGQNMASLGGFSDGFALTGLFPRAISGAGGWVQLSFPILSRLTLNTYGGLQSPRVVYLSSGSLTHESEYAANLIYRLGPNVLLGAEALQERSGYLTLPGVVRNHYDLAIGYLF